MNKQDMLSGAAANTHTHSKKKKLKWLILHPENILENFALKICFGKNFYVPIW